MKVYASYFCGQKLTKQLVFDSICMQEYYLKAKFHELEDISRVTVKTKFGEIHYIKPNRRWKRCKKCLTRY